MATRQVWIRLATFTMMVGCIGSPATDSPQVVHVPEARAAEEYLAFETPSPTGWVSAALRIPTEAWKQGPDGMWVVRFGGGLEPGEDLDGAQTTAIFLRSGPEYVLRTATPESKWSLERTATEPTELRYTIVIAVEGATRPARVAYGLCDLEECPRREGLRAVGSMRNGSTAAVQTHWPGHTSHGVEVEDGRTGLADMPFHGPGPLVLSFHESLPRPGAFFGAFVATASAPRAGAWVVEVETDDNSTTHTDALIAPSEPLDERLSGRVSLRTANISTRLTINSTSPEVVPELRFASMHIGPGPLPRISYGLFWDQSVESGSVTFSPDHDAVTALDIVRAIS
jgi:hypothetical protein